MLKQQGKFINYRLTLSSIFSFSLNSPRRPYAPSSINDVRINDIVKFSRPGGKISKGVVKYIGPLPGKSDQYLGLELEDEGTNLIDLFYYKIFGLS